MADRAESDRIKAIVAGIRAVLTEPTQREEIVELAATLAYWQVQAEAALHRGRSDEPEEEDEAYRLGKEWLTPEEAAERLRVSEKWLSRRKHQLSFVHKMPGGGRGFRVSARELHAEMRRRRE